MLKTSIPFVDLRGKTLMDLLRIYPDKARQLALASRKTYGFASYAASAALLPLADWRSHQWLRRNGNPYLYEIESFAEFLDIRGIYSLNVAYEWGCTSGAFRHEDSVSMLRVLDWPFPEMGKHAMVVLQKGKAGEYYNVTWPATSGVFNAMAPGRFSAAINQAPMRSHNKSYVGDWFKNRLIAEKETAIPPAHLLRHVFDQADSYETAKRMLTGTPIALPAIFTLAGTKPGDGCVIERLERAAEVIELGAGQQVTAANHFNTSLSREGAGWRPRAEDSTGRYKQSCSIHGHDLEAGNFNWLRAPIINQFTRLCMSCDAGTGTLTVQGFEGMAQATEVFQLPTESYARKEAV